MNNSLSLGKIVKRYIKARRQTIMSVADQLDINYKTLDGRLNRNAIDAELLFQLANLLNIDLQWMSQLFTNNKSISFFEYFHLTRMSQEMRDAEKNIVLPLLDKHLDETLYNVSESKSLLMHDFSNLFYLLDVLLPEDYIIQVTRERGRDKYLCMQGTKSMTILPRRGRSAVNKVYEGHEMLKLLILERKENFEL